MKFEINRKCPLTGRYSSNVIGYVKAESVWKGNSNYRQECANILGIENGDLFPIVESQCGFSYAGWLPSSEFLTKVYEDAIDHSKTLTEQIGYRLELVHFASAILRMVARSLAHPDQHKRLLDFGCGYGALLRILGSKNIETTGFEPSDERRAIAAKFANSVFSDLKSVGTTGPYDIVICTEVLEHVPNPSETIQTLRSLTARGGLLCVTVPLCHPGYVANCFNEYEDGVPLPRVINPWEHLNYFSAESLRTIISQGGFEVISDFGRSRPAFASALSTGDRERSSSALMNIFRAAKHILTAKPSTEIICRAV